MKSTLLWIAIVLVARLANAEEAPNSCQLRLIESLIQSEQKTSRKKMGAAVSASVAAHAVVGAAVLNQKIETQKQKAPDDPIKLKAPLPPPQEEKLNAFASDPDSKTPNGKSPVASSKVKTKEGDWSNFLDEEGKIKEPTVDIRPPRKRVKSTQELIAEAKAGLKLWKEKRKTQDGLGSWVIQTELRAEKDQESAEMSHVSIDKTYTEQVSRIQDIIKKQVADLPRLEETRKDLLKSMTNYCRDLARMTDILQQGCGDCVSGTLLSIAALTDSKYPIPDGYELGAQQFKTHIQPVLYNKSKNEVIEIKTGLKMEGVQAPIYSPALFYAAYLESQKIKPALEPDDYLLAEINRPVDLGGKPKPQNFRTNALMRFNAVVNRELPDYQIDEPPQFARSEYQPIRDGGPTSEFAGSSQGVGGGSGSGGSRIQLPSGMSAKDFDAFLAPRGALAQHPAEIQAVRESPLGIAYLRPFGRDHQEILIGDYQSLDNLNSAQLEKEKSKRVIYFQHPEELKEYNNLRSPAEKRNYIREKAQNAIARLSKSRGFHLLQHYLNHPQIISKLPDKDAREIESTFVQLIELKYHLDHIDEFFYWRLANPTSVALSHDLLQSLLAKQTQKSLEEYFNSQNRAEVASLKFVDALPVTTKKNFFKLNSILGAGRYSSMNYLARVPSEVAVKSLHEEELKLEKVVTISLAGENQDKYRVSLEQQPQGNALKTEGSEPKKSKGDQAKKKDETIPVPQRKLDKDVIKIKPETMVGLILSERDEKGYLERNDTPYWYYTALRNNTAFNGMTQPDETMLAKQWIPGLEDVFLKHYNDGRFDDEFVKVIESVEPAAKPTYREVTNLFGSETLVRFKAFDRRDPKVSPRARGEDGVYEITDADYYLPPRIAEALKAAYQRRFGAGVRIEIGQPMTWSELKKVVPKPVSTPSGRPIKSRFLLPLHLWETDLYERKRSYP